MKTFRFSFLFIILTGWSISAWNLDSTRLSSDNNGLVPVRVVFVDSDGIKWFGTDHGLYRYDNLQWSYYTESDYLAGNKVCALEFEHSDLGSALWVATDKGVTELYYTMEGVIACASYTVEDGLLNDSITDVAIDSYHRKFFGSSSGITVFHKDSVDYLTYDEYPMSMVNASVNKLHLFNDTLYIGAEGGIGRFVSGVDGLSGASRWTSEYGITPLSGNIKSIFVDSKGHQWFGTDLGAEQHIGPLAKENWFLYTTAEGLVDNFVLDIAEDESGAMWFGTRGGISHLKNGEWTSFTAADGLASDTVYDIAFDLDGSIWFATHRGISRLENSVFNNHFTYTLKKESEQAQLTAWFDKYSKEIHINFHANTPGTAIAELYTMDGKLCIQSRHSMFHSGIQEIHLSPGHYGVSLESGIYIVRLQTPGNIKAQMILITK